jgi:hypothetical protein
VPAANELPEFVVVLLNAENVPNPARALAAPTRSNVSRIFRGLPVIAVTLLWLRSNQWRSRATDRTSANLREEPSPERR